jgi:hypothetical protein
MNKFFGVALFCTSFFSYAAEKPNSQGPKISTRSIDLGDTGGERIPISAELSGVKKRPSSHALQRNRRNSDPAAFYKEENISPRGGGFVPGYKGVEVPSKDTK